MAIIKASEKKQEIIRKNINDLKKLEDFYINGTVEDLVPVLKMKQDELVTKMVEYAERNTKPVKWDKDGCVLREEVAYNPVVLSNTFFKTIVPFGARQPLYNAEKLCIVYDYYMYLITEVNDKIGSFPPTLTGFCKMAGITLSTLREYKNSPDLDMRNVVEKIYDQIGDETLTMSQLGVAKERSTLFRLKSQNEMVEKTTPNVNITYKEVINTDKMDSNLLKYRTLLDKKDK